jgi:hypothetical protein
VSEFIAELAPDEVPVAAEARISLDEAVARPAAKPEETPSPDRIRAVAHLADGVLTGLNHSARHLDAAKTSASNPERLRFNLEHLDLHLGDAVDHARRLVAGLAAYYPEIGAELGKLHQVTQPARSAPGRDGEYLPVIADERDELRSFTPLPRPVRPATDDDYDVVFPRPGAPEPA